MFKHVQDYRQHDNLTAQEAAINAQLNGQAPNAAQAAQLANIRQAAGMIVRRVKQAYTRTVASIKQLGQNASNVMKAPVAGMFSILAGVAAEITNEFRRINLDLNYRPGRRIQFNLPEFGAA